VTEGDISRFTKELFQKWNLNLDAVEDSDNMSLVEAAPIARGKCVLVHLNGAATIIYGVPCCLK